MNEANVSVTDDTLQRLPVRVFTFLTAVGGDAASWGLLATRGYTLAIHMQGWALLDEVCGRVTVPTATPSKTEAEVEQAVAVIDAWDEPTFAIARATLQHRFPEQCSYLFADNLQPARGRGAVLSSMTFLHRLDGLEKAPEREATRAQDHAALAALAERGIGLTERAHVISQIALVQRGSASTPTPTPTPVESRAAKLANGKAAKPAQAEAAAPARDSKRELWVWYSEWSGVARALIKSRGQLIGMGLANRRKPRPVKLAPQPPASAPRPTVAPPA